MYDIALKEANPEEFFRAKGNHNIVFPWPEDSSHTVMSENHIIEAYKAILESKKMIPHIGDLYASIWGYNMRVASDIAAEYMDMYIVPRNAKSMIKFYDEEYDDTMDYLLKQFRFTDIMGVMDSYVTAVLNKYHYSFVHDSTGDIPVICNDCQNRLYENFASRGMFGYGDCIMLTESTRKLTVIST